MKRWLVGILAGLAIAAGLSAYAVTAGGFPSRPFLQSLGIGIKAPATTGQLQTAGNAVIGGSLSTAGNASIGGSGLFTGTASISPSTTAVQLNAGNNPQIVWINGLAPTDEHDYDSYADSTGTLHFRTDNDAQTGANDWLDVSRQGFTPTAINFPNGIVETNGLPIGAFSAEIATSSSGCSVYLQPASKYTGCTRTSIGQYTVTFTAAGSAVPLCVVSPIDSAGSFNDATNGETSTSVKLQQFSGAGFADDNNNPDMTVSCSYQ